MAVPEDGLTDQALRDVLRRCGLFDSSVEPAFDRLTRLASVLLTSSVALLTFVDEGRHVVKSQLGLAAAQANGHDIQWLHAFCRHVVKGGVPLVVDDAGFQPELQHNLPTAGVDVVAYLGLPLMIAEDRVIGSLIVADRRPRAWKPEDIALLRDVAAVVMTEIELRREAARRHDDLESLMFQARIIDSVQDVVIATDHAYRVRLWNRAAEATFGWPAAEAMGKGVEELIPVQRYLGGGSDGESGIILQSAGTWKGDVVQCHRDGHEIVLEAVVQIVFDEQGAPVGVVTVSREMTARLEAEELRRAKEVAELASQAKSAFLSRVSHELRTPLHAILGFAQLLRIDNQNLGPEQRDNVEYIVGAGRHLLKLVDEVLDIAEIEAGERRMLLEAVHVGEIIDGIGEVLQHMALAKQISVFVESCDDPEARVLADRQRLVQVVLNLTSNAIKYTPPGGVVTLQCVLRDELVCLMVTDTGVGIPVDKMARLFMPFDRLDAEHTEVDGVGLGLALCKVVVEELGGRIGANSTAGQGTTLWVELPLLGVPTVNLPGPGKQHVARHEGHEDQVRVSAPW